MIPTCWLLTLWVNINMGLSLTCSNAHICTCSHMYPHASTFGAHMCVRVCARALCVHNVEPPIWHACWLIAFGYHQHGAILSAQQRANWYPTHVDVHMMEHTWCPYHVLWTWYLTSKYVPSFDINHSHTHETHMMPSDDVPSSEHHGSLIEVFQDHSWESISRIAKGYPYALTFIPRIRRALRWSYDQLCWS